MWAYKGIIFVIKDPMLGYMLYMNLEQLTLVLFRAIYMHARAPLSLTKTGSRCDVPRFCHSYMWDTHILLTCQKVDWAFNTTTSSQMICQCLDFICNKENKKCQTWDFQPLCHNNGQVSGEWPNYISDYDSASQTQNTDRYVKATTRLGKQITCTTPQNESQCATYHSA